MAETNFKTAAGQNAPAGVKPRTITIDAKCKEFYFQSPKLIVKDTPRETQHKQVFWNYMMNVSMQNTLVQMSKRA